jgi:orotate phosphoribosyltransferase-like protein
LSTKSDQLEWRRTKVIELRARGLSHGEIAHELQVSRTSITSDIAYLRSQAKESIKEYATDHLPEQYQHSILYSNIHLIYWRPQTTIEKAAGNGSIQRYTSSRARVTVQCYDHR